MYLNVLNVFLIYKIENREVILIQYQRLLKWKPIRVFVFHALILLNLAK